MASLGTQLLGAAATAAALPAAPPAPTAGTKPAAVLAVFPPYLPEGYLTQVHGGFVDNLATDLRARSDIDLRYSAFSLMADGRRVKDLGEIQDIATRSWTGFFSKEPDWEFVRNTATPYEINVVVMYRLGETLNCGSHHAYVMDVPREQIFEDSGDWEIGGWNLALRGAIGRLLDRYASLK